MSDIYLSDEQYLEMLKTSRSNLDKIKKISLYDCDDIGFKDTQTNIGLCNDFLLCTKENALFPEQFPKRKDIKYRKNHHLCPLDSRKKSDGNGCFHTCMAFKRKIKTIDEVKKAYDLFISKIVVLK